jgi:O-antigen/teichoic acid export membrane protein
MLVVLARGGGLIGISAVYVIGTILNEIARVVLAFRVCPELRVSLGRARWSEARGLLAFGAKLSSVDVASIVVAQLTNLLVLSQIGIMTLAVYSRLAALIRHTENIAAKYSQPLTPTASSLQGTGRDGELRDLVVTSTQFAAYLIWPILIGLMVAGDEILLVWMGPQYDPSHVLTLMAMASLIPLSQQPIFTILVGLNLHGRFAVVRIVGSVLGFLGSLVALRWLHWDLLGLAAVGLAASNITSLLVTIDTCRQLSIPLREYFVRAYAGPLACVTPFALGLIGVSVAFSGRPVTMLAMACAVGGAILVPLYWRAAPLALRAQVMARLTGAIGLLRPVRQAEW